jgi:preprotein translocase subunit SecD
MQSRYRMWIGLILLTIVLAFLVAFAPIRPVPREVGFDVQSTNRYSFPEPVAQDADGMEAKANEIRDTLTKAGVELDHVKFLDSSLLEVATVALTQESADQQANEVFQTLKADYPGLQKAEEEIAAETVEQPIFTVGTVFAVYPPKPQIRLGLDLQGGAHVLLRCVPETKIPFSTPEHQPMAITQALMDTPKEDRPTTTSDGKPITYPSFTHDQLQKLVYDYLIANGVDEQGLQVTVAGNNQLLIHTEAREQREVDVQLKLAQGFVERTFPTLEVSVGSVESVFVEPGTAETVKNIIDRRLYSMSDIREPIVQKQGDDKIIVELPGVKDPDRVLEILQSTAMLEFRLVPARYTPTSADQDDYGEWADSRTNQSVAWEQVMLESDLAFSGRDLMSNAEVSPDPAGQWVVNFELKAEKKREFLEFTRQNVGRLMAIVLDGQCQMAPNIRGPIPGKGIIEGNFTSQEARDLKLLLNAGALPVPLEIDTNRTVSPTLGTDAIIRSFRAGVIGFMLVLVFMIGVYRVPGLMAAIALSLYAILLLAVLTLANATLTLPGVAAFILSIGMAVDANIIIFERLKEELWSGKVMRAAVEAGFDRAWTAILDANVTTLLAATVLYFLGTSMIKSFAVTLFLGVCCSLFTAVTVTRWLVTMVGSSRLGEKRTLFGSVSEPNS